MEITDVYNMSLENALDQFNKTKNQLYRIRQEKIENLSEEYWLDYLKKYFFDCVYFITSIYSGDRPNTSCLIYSINDNFVIYDYIDDYFKDINGINFSEYVENFYDKYSEKKADEFNKRFNDQYVQFDTFLYLSIDEIQDCLIGEVNNFYFAKVCYKFIADKLYDVYNKYKDEIYKKLLLTYHIDLMEKE